MNGRGFNGWEKKEEEDVGGWSRRKEGTKLPKRTYCNW